MKNAIVLCSGGIDSIVTARYVWKKRSYKKIILLFFNYGQKGLTEERRCSKKCAKTLGACFVEISILGNENIFPPKIKIEKSEIKSLRNTKNISDKYYVPYRNSIFLIYSMAFAEKSFLENKDSFDIFVGFQSEGSEGYPDTTKEFVRSMNNLSKHGKFKGKIIAPLINKDKDEIVMLGEKLDVDFKNTFSCYHGRKVHCGICLACCLRKKAFYWANIKDKTCYRESID